MITEAQWALIQMLDGVKKHDLPNQTGCSEQEADRIWRAYEDARWELLRRDETLDLFKHGTPATVSLVAEVRDAQQKAAEEMKPLYSKGDQILLKVPTLSGWQGIGVLLNDIYDIEALDSPSVVAFHKQGDDSDSAPCLAVIGEIAPLLPQLPDFAELHRQNLQSWWEKRKAQHGGNAKNQISDRTFLALKKANDIGVLEKFCALASERSWLTLGFAGYMQTLKHLAATDIGT